GLASNHPRWIAAVLVNESSLAFPCGDPGKLATDPLARWLDASLRIDPNLIPCVTASFADGADRYADIVPADFFDDDWVLGDDCPGNGIHSLTDLEDLSIVVAPDLYSPRPLAPIESVMFPTTFAGAEFSECIAPASA